MLSHHRLRTITRGKVVLAGDDEYDAARMAWNPDVDQLAVAVVHAMDVADIVAVVGYARSAGLSVAAQPTGLGACGNVAGAIVVRTDNLDRVEIDPARRRVRIGAGVRWGPMLTVAGSYGLTGLAGSWPSLSAVGHPLGGGLSWFGRKYGWAADHVRSFDVVDAHGRRVRVSEESDPELFWGMRGGGGDFAFVTAVEFDLLPAPPCYGGRMIWPTAYTAAVREAFLDITEHAPLELTVRLDRLRLPQGPSVIAIATAYLGVPERGRELLRRFDRIGELIADTRRERSPAELGQIDDEPIMPSSSPSRTELLTVLDQAATETLLTVPIDPLTGIQLQQLGGALAAPTRGANPPVSEAFALSLQARTADPDEAAAVLAAQRHLLAELGPRISGRKPYAFLTTGDSSAQAFPAATLARLRKLKRARDPHAVFRANFAIPA
ncbi:FAD-binding oxidoreductase [Nocardia yamanashiensis]|uniref:FAD-binding oxidoreductase n=1 Tax=Nocardia yamanashiensis TaxID=209247 RepID=UPI0008366FFD|nr:FAD-binding oxidoreductase [Nocardia yamanashiensis]